LAHRVVGRRCGAAGLADQQVSPTGFVFAPMQMETAIIRISGGPLTFAGG